MRAFNNITAIFRREISGYFGSPVAYVFIVIFLLLLGFFTFNLNHFFEIGQADLRRFFEWHPWIYMFLIPAVAMRLWSEELRMGTVELILTFPIRVGEVVVGKFLAAWLFITIAISLTFPMVLTVMYLGDPDLGATLCAYVGSIMLAGTFLSIGIMTSGLTDNQVISFILAIVVCLFFILAGYPPITELVSGWAPTWIVNTVAGLSVLSHYNSIERGVLDLRDMVYFISVIVFMLSANGIIIQNRRTA